MIRLWHYSRIDWRHLSFNLISKMRNMKKIFSWFLNPPVTGPSTFLIIRFIGGGVFLCEGLLNLFYGSHRPEQFATTRILSAEIVGHLIFAGQIVGGLLLIFGLFTRITTFYFLMYFSLQVISAEVSFYMGSYGSPLPPEVVKSFDWFPLYYKISTHYAQLLTAFFLMVEGPGRVSLDFKRATSGKVYTMIQN
jgi:putative oxidoreductase